MVIDDVFAVIAEGTRRDILEALAQEQKAVGQLVDELGVSQPTVSKHLRVLREAGVVTMRAQGQKRFYSLHTAPLAQVTLWLEGLGASSAAHAPKDLNGHKPAAAPAKLSAAPLQQSGSTPAAAATLPAGASANGPSTTASRTAVPAAAVPGRPIHGTSRPEAAPAATRPASPVRQTQIPAVIRSDDHENSMPQQITRSVGRAANKAADLLANLPTFRRRKD